MTPAQLKAKASELFLQALVLTSGLLVRPCDHSDVEFVRGNLVHCKCGLSFEVDCQHIEVEQILPRVWRCVDCREWRGAGRLADEPTEGAA